ncbi:hypothetical protein RR48_12850 [Papilio machaon]|uniref:Chitin-binding type-2 domain-containing protein n=1 Tax=Papilio machaon TaxID=76193 RepID=A0A194QX11_PAPMA|nr:hypothetical protein RR48_12850 [Papilio machaon]
MLKLLYKLSSVNRRICSSDESRHPRGRVVKLYSGPKQEPITCYNEGFLAEPKDCSIFYRCIKASRGKYTVVKFQCSPGTVFDPEIETCNHPQNTKRSECRSSRPFQFISAPVEHFNDNEIETAVQEFPSPITTRKPIYDKQTINSESPSTSTGFPSPMPIAIQSSGYGAYLPPNQVQSTIKVQTNENTQTPLPSIISTLQPQWTLTSNQYVSTTTITAARLGNECIHDGFMGDTEDCRKFYRCVNDLRGGFKQFEFMCSESTIWDDNIQSCNHPWAVSHRRCGRDKSYSDYSSKDGEHYSQKNNSLHEEQLSTFESNKTEIPVTVNLPLSISHQTNYGEQISVDESTAWNDKNNVTNNIPSSQNNQEKQTYYPIREKEIGYITQSYETITKTSSYKPDVVRHDTSYNTNYKVINNACTESGFMGDPQDCRKFYRCVENGRGSFIKHEFQCGEGTAWDKKIESCNHVWMVKECGERGISNNFTSDRYEPENRHTTLSNTIKDDVASDNNVYNNWNDIEKHDISRPTTVLPVVTQTFEEPSKLNESQEMCNSVGFMGNRNNCKIFYRCVENSNGGFTKFAYLCGDGTAWDPNIEACNHVGQVKHCGPNVENQTIASISSTESTIITTVSFVQTTVQLSDNKPLPLPPPENDEHLNDNQSNDIYKDPIRTTEISTVLNKPNTTDTGSNKINSCINSGFIGDNLDCKKFYRCVSNGDGSFKQYEFSCGEGTVWDPEIEACNHACAVKKCGGSSNNQNEVSTSLSTTTKNISNEFESGYPTQGYGQTQQPVQNTVGLSTNSVPVSDKGVQCQSAGFMADKNDCKRFYRCVENGLGGFDRFEFYCGEGTMWDSDIQACNHASSVKDCSIANYNTTTSSPVEITQSMGTVSIEVDKNVSGQSETESPTTITSLYANNTCTSDGFYGDEKDCKKFYRCVGNQQGGFLKYEFNCGEGTVWDQNIQACNHASIDNETCKGSTSVTKAPSTVITSGNTETYNTLHPEESSTQESSDIPGLSNTCSAEGFYPNPRDCKKFFRCVSNGKGYIRYDFTCGEGTIWVQDIQACDHDSDNSTCSAQSVTENEVTSTTPATSSYVDTEQKTTEAITPIKSTTSTSDSASIIDGASNVAECRSEGYFGNQEDCQKFYRCVNDGKGKFVRYDYICGDGTIWDQDILTCNHPRDVTNRSCDNKTTSENTESSIQSTTSASSSTQSSSTPSMSTQTTTSSMSTETATSSMTTQTATSSQPTQTTTSSTTTPTEISSMPTQTETSSMMTQTTTSAMQTQTTSPSKSTQTTTPSSSTESTTTSTEGSSQETPINSGEGTSKNPTTQNITCTKAGFYPHPSDCKKFYRCVDWDGDGRKFSVFHFECGEGTIWDPALDTCNYEESVYPPRNCRATQAQVTNTSQGTSTAQTPTTESTTPQQSSGETTSTQSTLTEGQTTEQLSSTNQMSSSTTTPTDTTSTTITSPDTSSTTVPPTEITSTTVRPTDSTSTTSDQTTSEQSTTDTTTTQSDKSTTTTKDTSTSENTSSTSEQTTISEQTTTTTEATTSTTEQQTSTTLEQSSTEQPTTQTTASATEETTSQGSTTEQLTSTESSTEVSNTSTTEATPSSTGSTTENTEATTTQGGSTVKDCPETEDDQYLYACPTSFKRHPKYCNLFYQCIENNDNHELKIATFNCPNGTIYDESKIQCVEESKAAKKCQGAIAKNRRIKRLNLNSKETISVNENKYGCTGVGHFPFEKNEECSPAILKCEISKRGKLQGFVYRCPDNYVYWSVSRRCEPILRMAACKYSSNQWIGRSEIPIETKNIA